MTNSERARGLNLAALMEIDPRITVKKVYGFDDAVFNIGFKGSNPGKSLLDGYQKNKPNLDKDFQQDIASQLRQIFGDSITIEDRPRIMRVTTDKGSAAEAYFGEIIRARNATHKKVLQV